MGLRVVVSAALAVCLVLSGVACKSTKKPPAGASANEAPPPMDESRAGRLASTTQQLVASVNHLPSGSDRDDQATIGTALDHVATALRLLKGDEGTGAFQMQIETIQRTRDRLAQGITDAPVEPAINSALWSVFHALRGLSDDFATDDETQQRIAALPQQLVRLDGIRGPLHRLAAGEVLKSEARVIARMSDLVSAAAVQHPPAGSQPAAGSAPGQSS